MICKKTCEMKVKETCMPYQGRHQQPEKEPIGKVFKQHYKQQISRGKRSSKWVVLWTCEVMIEEWRNAIIRLGGGLLGDQS